MDRADDLLRFIDASPMPHQAVAECVRRLTEAGYMALDERETFRVEPEAKVFVVRSDTTLAAFHVGRKAPSEAGILFAGAHTDSPNLRVKPNPITVTARCAELGVEIYGSPLFYTWLDRDLGLAGRVIVADERGSSSRLVHVNRAFARIPSLAIHLQRTVNTDGLVVNPQRHLPAITALVAEREEPPFAAWLAEELGRAGNAIVPEAILGWDLGLHDVQPASRAGHGGELLSAPRLDNLASCHAALTALLESDGAADATRAIVLFDHEEVGSRSAQGAASSFLTATLERLVAAIEPGRSDALRRALARSFFFSVDMAHATHPNHVDRHEPQHRPDLGSGPVLKIHTSQSYATDAEGWARFERCARAADVHTQRFVVRSDTACGSTIGPITAAQLGIPTADIGSPMLAMHAARETAAAADVDATIHVLGAFFAGTV